MAAEVTTPTIMNSRRGKSIMLVVSKIGVPQES